MTMTFQSLYDLWCFVRLFFLVKKPHGLWLQKWTSTKRTKIPSLLCLSFCRLLNNISMRFGLSNCLGLPARAMWDLTRSSRCSWMQQSAKCWIFLEYLLRILFYLKMFVNNLKFKIFNFLQKISFIRYAWLTICIHCFDLSKIDWVKTVHWN